MELTCEMLTEAISRMEKNMIAQDKLYLKGMNVLDKMKDMKFNSYREGMEIYNRLMKEGR